MRQSWVSVEPGVREQRDVGNPPSSAPLTRDLIRLLLIGLLVWTALQFTRGLWPHELRRDMDDLHARVEKLEKRP